MNFRRTTRKPRWTLEAICAAVGIHLTEQSSLHPGRWVYAIDPYIPEYLTTRSARARALKNQITSP